MMGYFATAALATAVGRKRQVKYSASMKETWLETTMGAWIVLQQHEEHRAGYFSRIQNLWGARMCGLQ